MINGIVDTRRLSELNTKRNLSKATKVVSNTSDSGTFWAAASRKNVSGECHSSLSLFSANALLVTHGVNQLQLSFCSDPV